MEIMHDVQRATRRLRSTPAFTVAAALTLALGIGATTAVWSVVEDVLLEPLPFDDGSELVGIWHTAPGTGIDLMPNSPGAYLAYREENRTLVDIGIWGDAEVTVTGLGEPERLVARGMTSGVLDSLRIEPHLGRRFSPEDDRPGAPDVVLLDYGYWQQRLGGERSALGSTITLNGTAFEIVGVLPQGFRLLQSAAPLYLPMRLDPATSVFGGGFGFRGVARLRPGITPEEAERDLARIVPIAVERYGGATLAQVEEIGLRPVVHALKDDVVGDIGTVLWLLLGAVGLVLLIACTNVANLFLVRAEARRHEVALQVALGASPGRIVRPFLSESLLLALLGAVGGLGLAWALLELLRALAPADLPRAYAIGVDGTTLAVTAALALLTGLGFGLAPALGARRVALAAGLRGGARAVGPAGARHSARGALAAAQIAMALVLVIGAGLMVRTFDALRQVDPGFTRPDEVLTFELGIPSARAPRPDDVARLHEEVLGRLAAVPGVASVAAATAAPMTGGNTWVTYVSDAPPVGRDLPPSRRYEWVTGDYFATLGSRLLSGRFLDWSDVHRRAPVVVVTESFARQNWNQPEQALGKKIRSNPADPWREIVGVVGDVRDAGMSAAPPAVIYWPLATEHFDGRDVYVPRSLDYLVRIESARPGAARASPSSLLPELRRAVRSVLPEAPLARVRPLDRVVADSMARDSLTMTLLGIAAATALLLGVVGTYGVISYAVQRRDRELGVRIALGAGKAQVARLVLAMGLGVAAAGAVVGLASAAMLTRLMENLLYGVTPIDAPTYAASTVAVVGVALLAAYLPARRAASVNPVDVLRHD